MSSLIWKSPVGWLRVVAGRDGIRQVEFHRRLEEFAGSETAGPPDPSADDERLLDEARRQIDAYFAGTLSDFDLPLDLSSLSLFARRVLRTLRKVPCGSTLSYGELARKAGSPGAARAVGGVMAANPLPILIPCHRVVPASGGLGGYSGGEGSSSKRWLLEHEAALVSSGSGDRADRTRR